MKKSLTISIEWIGLTLVLGTILKILVQAILYLVIYKSYLIGKISATEYVLRIDRWYDTASYAMVLFLNLIVSCLIFQFFFSKKKQEDAEKIFKIGFIGVIVALIFQITNIILYIIVEIREYNYIYANGFISRK